MPPSFFSFTHLVLLSMILYSLGYPAGQLGSALLALCPPNFLSTPRSLMCGVKSEKGLDCRHCSAEPKTFMLSNYKHSTKAATMKKLTLSPLKPHTNFFFSYSGCDFSYKALHTNSMTWGASASLKDGNDGTLWKGKFFKIYLFIFNIFNFFFLFENYSFTSWTNCK